MKKDIFENECKNPILWILVGIVVLAGFLSFEIKQIVDLIFFFIIGGLCLYNYNRCGRVHCQITGYGFTFVGILALLLKLDVISFNYNWLWGLFFVFLIVGYGIEFLHKGKKGTCYKK